MSHCRWNLLPPVTSLPEKGGSTDYSPLLIQLLHNRGINKLDDIKSFIASDRTLMADPFLFTDMQKVVERVQQAVQKGETIAIYGDFDADGITSTALLTQGLGLLGGKTIPYIPHRQTEGHGLTTQVLKMLHEKGVGLVITVDCGVTDVAEVQSAAEMGLDVIITDHHSPLDEIPKALAVINPKVGEQYPYTNLAGVGVALKLLQALYRSEGKEDQLNTVMDLVAIGTIADMSSPLGENRYFIKEGLNTMNNSPRLGIRELINQTRLEAGKIDAEKIGWVIAPCLNAAGRLADGLTGYHLLTTQSEKEAQELASWLTRTNEERQRLTTTTLAKAREQVIATGLQPLLITANKEYPMGIAGLVASRLTEEFYRPSVVIHVADDVCHGSCRSIPEFDIIAALNKYSGYLSRYGGHAAAAGFTMPCKDLPQLEKELIAFATQKLTGVELQPHLNIDAEVKLNDLGGDVYPTTLLLAPFGHGNPVPTFLSRGVNVVERRTMGATNDHLRMRLMQGSTVWDAVAFRLSNHQEEFAQQIDVVYNLEVDTWNGKNTLRLNILDFKKSVGQE
ncbi:MAG: single-stranded-DNA-specific exonuclease RecJ [Dehalococcoidales bacterium]|nr:single-stranded-DNA-specific exonuclease RecJ [Dehalococcoidales bacterium]